MSFRAALGAWFAMSAVLAAVAIWRAPHLGDGFFRPLAPRLALVDDRGSAFSLPRASGSVTVLVFGYTRCSDECPLQLARIAALFRTHPAWRGKAVVAFVTVDPLHDDARTLHGYLAHFDPSFVGVTGSPKLVADALRAYAVERAGARDDPRSHAVGITVVDRRGRVAGVVEPNLDNAVLPGLIDRVLREAG